MKPADKLASSKQMLGPETVRWRLGMVAKESGNDLILNSSQGHRLTFGNKPYHFRIAIEFI